jgi:hypothetical protein
MKSIFIDMHRCGRVWHLLLLKVEGMVCSFDQSRSIYRSSRILHLLVIKAKEVSMFLMMYQYLDINLLGRILLNCFSG